MGRYLIVVLLALVASKASAQQWGTGQWGGTQGCESRMAEGSSSALDDVREAKAAISEAERQMKAKKRQLKTLDKDLDRARKDIESVISVDFVEFIFEHIETRRDCQEYEGLAASGESVVCPPNSEGCVQAAGIVAVRGYTVTEWTGICDSNRMGAVNGGAACSLPRSRDTDSVRGAASDCSKGLSLYSKKYAEKSKLEREIERLESSIEGYKDAIQTAKEEYLDELRERRESSSEGGFCIDCELRQDRGTDWAGVLSNVGVGLLGVYMGYQSNKMMSENNAALGWPSQTYPSWSYGFPYLANGIYGALGGATGQGAFGCGTGMGQMGGGGAFGYPQGMYGSPMGGGMYLGGMTPWGMNGPNGGMMGGMPMMGMQMGGGMAMSGGMMMNGMMMNGMQMSGMQMMGMQMNGMAMSGGMMMNGMMMNGMQMNGMQMMGGNSSMQMQYQQQMLEMQMQQAQQYYQYQQQYQQNYMQKQQVSMQLQSEIYTLMSRLQQIQYGSDYGVGTIGTGLYGTGTIGTGSVIGGGVIGGGTIGSGIIGTGR